MRHPSATIMTGSNTQLRKEIAYHQRGASKSRSSSSYWWRQSKPKTSLWGTWTSTPSKSSVRKWSRTPIDSTARISSTQRTFQLTRHPTQNPCKFSFRVSSSLFEKAQTWWQDRAMAQIWDWVVYTQRGASREYYEEQDSLGAWPQRLLEYDLVWSSGPFKSLLSYYWQW